jgi:hypothetical protein
MGDSAKHEFDREDFQRVLTVLETEQNAMQLSRRQLLSLRLYRISINGFVITLIAALWYLIAKMRKEQMSEHETVVLGLLWILAGVCLLCAGVALLLNLKLIWQIIHSRFRFRRLGFSDNSEALWKAHQKTRRWSATTEKLALVASVVFILLAAILAASQQWVGVVATLCISATFVMFYVLQSGKARMDMMAARLAEVSRLKQSMQCQADSSGEAGAPVVLSSNAVQQFARIETEQIARSRAQAINEAARTKKREYSILPSQQVREAKTSLTAAEYLRVEEASDALMRDPRPAAAENDAAAGMWRLRVAGTTLELVYGIDDSSLQVKVVALQPSQIGSVSHA